MGRKVDFLYVLITLLLLLPLAHQSVSAHERPAEDVEYTVVSGDTLSKIAKKYGVTVEDLYKANNLKSDLITVGMKLTIPGTSRVPMPTKPPTVSSEEKPSALPKESQVSPKKPSETTKKTAAIPEEQSIPRGTVNFKWAFVARLDPEGRNRCIDVAAGRRCSSGVKASNVSVTKDDKIALYVQPSESTYVYIYLLDSRKKLELIFPTSMDDDTLESEFVPEKGTYVPGKYEWFSFDEGRGTETFYVLASPKRLTRLEGLTRDYINADTQEKQELAKQKVLDEILGTKRLVAFTNPIERPISFGGRFRGLQIDIAKLAVEVEAPNLYSKTISIKHE